MRMSRQVHSIVIALVVIAIAVAGVWLGIANLLHLHADVAMGASSTSVVGSSAGVVLTSAALIVIAAMELIRPGVKGQNRLFGTGLALFCLGLIALPVFPFVMGEVLSGRGYRECLGPVVGYTRPASRWALSPAACAAAIAR